MSMKKKIATGALLVAFGATAVTGATLAYFTDEDSAANTFTVGNVTIDLTEPDWDKEGGGKEQAETVYPGEGLPKDPTVQNTGNNPCFVRVSVTGLDVLKNIGASAEDISYETDWVPGKLGENWVKGADDYFYYTKVLQPGEYALDLFEQIRIPKDLTNENGAWDGNNFNIIVKAEAVQAQGAKASWAAVQTMTVEEIAAWFDTCMADQA